ncbi:MAG: molybdopterin molybdotransferase MoeA [Anaerolineae bacterium]|nr:molybdopterin molybdotransferase MoeA [Anaerolineae bacterium]
MPEFFTLVAPDEARARILEQAAPLGQTEIIPTHKAAGRTLCADVPSPQVLPEFRRSAMDGYAVQAQDTFGAGDALPAYLKLAGEVPMGCAAAVDVGPGAAVLVHTGGMLPDSADAVVMIENTQLVGQDEIEVCKPVAPGENVIQVGEDIALGDPILTSGHILRAQDVGGLLAVGIVQVEVMRRPRVAIFATGDEVIEPYLPTRPGQVRDINSYIVAALAERAGAEAVRGSILPDDFDTLLVSARQALDNGADMLVLSAGSSVSVRDMTADVFNRLGEPGVLVHGIATRPGKPTILGMAQGVPLMGLPGNPVSAFVQFAMIGLPVIYRLLGTAPPKEPSMRARLAANIASTAGREDYVPCTLAEQDGELWAEPIFFKSNLIFTLVKADGLLVIPLDKTGLEAGEWVRVRRV